VRSCLYTGHLAHHRRAPVEHSFRYPMAVFCLDLDELEDLQRRVRGFGVNRRNLVSFLDHDHLDGSSGATKAKVLRLLAARGIELEGGKVLLLTQCRIFGYVFNPVSFYYCFDSTDQLRSVVAEVNNTFGERYIYVLAEEERLPQERTTAGRASYEARKVMHVSPFVSMDATYEFHFAPVEARLSVLMHEHERGRRIFDAHLWGRRLPLTSGAIVSLLLRYPLLTSRVIAAIHWQALRLYMKGVPFHRQPQPTPQQQTQQRFLQSLREEVAG
jgi:DUF1365 family protein